MAGLTVSRYDASLTLDVDSLGPILQQALNEADAAPVLRCAVLMALSAIAEGGAWPMAALEHMSVFMSDMKAALEKHRLM
jgi:hypothetical protein